MSREASLLAILTSGKPTVAPEREARGNRLGPGPIKITPSERSSLVSSSCFDSQQITIISSKCEYRIGRTIQVSKDVLVYAMRGGKLRVIGLSNGETVLLKENTQTLLDISLQNNILATTSLDDTFRVWKISSADGNITPNVLITIHGYKTSNEVEATFGYLNWHPVLDNVIAITTSLKQVWIFDLNEILKDGQVTFLDLSDYLLQDIVGLKRIELTEVAILI